MKELVHIRCFVNGKQCRIIGWNNGFSILGSFSPWANNIQESIWTDLVKMSEDTKEIFLHGLKDAVEIPSPDLAGIQSIFPGAVVDFEGSPEYIARFNATKGCKKRSDASNQVKNDKHHHYLELKREQNIINEIKSKLSIYKDICFVKQSSINSENSKTHSLPKNYISHIDFEELDTIHENIKGAFSHICFDFIQSNNTEIPLVSDFKSEKIIEYFISNYKDKTVSLFLQPQKWEDISWEPYNVDTMYGNPIVLTYGLYHNIPFLKTNIDFNLVDNYIHSLRRDIANIRDEYLLYSNELRERIEEECISSWIIKLNDLSSGIIKMKSLLDSFYKNFDSKLKNHYDCFKVANNDYEEGKPSGLINLVLNYSVYPLFWEKDITCEYDSDKKELIVDYILPNYSLIPSFYENIRTVDYLHDYRHDYPAYLQLSKKRLAESKRKEIYVNLLQTIVIRSIAEILNFDSHKIIDFVVLNGKRKDRNPATGQMEEKYVLSLSVSREDFQKIDLRYANPVETFKLFKGVLVKNATANIEITPIKKLSFADKRIVQSHDVEVSSCQNLAEMDWEEFEHFVRQVLQWEFESQGASVNVTQASRDGGVDAIIVDPDPLRGGKIIVQAKRYTNTVPVSAVRDLYGTIINEGANKGIIITTSDYGPDSYKFAIGKPITLLNGGHLLFLLRKHGQSARIDLKEAKQNLKRNF